jgi:hypothetical protein
LRALVRAGIAVEEPKISALPPVGEVDPQ